MGTLGGTLTGTPGSSTIPPGAPPGVPMHPPCNLALRLTLGGKLGPLKLQGQRKHGMKLTMVGHGPLQQIVQQSRSGQRAALQGSCLKVLTR